MSLTTHPRLLICTDSYPPQVNGVSVVTSLCVTGLAARGWNVAVVAPRYPAGVRGTFPTDTGCAGVSELVSLPSAPLPYYPDIRVSLPNGRTVSQLLDRHQPDLVHCATEFTIGWLGASLARRRGLPVVTSYHTDFSRYADAYGVPWLGPAVARHLARFHRRAWRTYTPSASAESDLRAMGVHDVEVWGRGVDTMRFHPRHRSTPLRGVYVRRDDTFLFLHVGRLAAEKGVDVILNAFARARAQLPAGAAHLVIAGAGPRADALRLLGSDDVTFVGNLDRERILPRLYASADAFVFASVTETLGLVVLEAMASGLPVIATTAGGVADHLRDGVNGVAVPAGNADAMARAMVALVLDRGRAITLGGGARETAEALDWSRELDRLDASYRAMLGGATKRAMPGAADDAGRQSTHGPAALRRETEPPTATVRVDAGARGGAGRRRRSLPLRGSS